MTKNQLEIIETLFNNAKKIQYGSVNLELKIHAGKCTSITYTISENIRQVKKDIELIE